MSKHTPEPWRVVDNFVIETNKQNIAVTCNEAGDPFGGDHDAAQANAQRIVACVNGCAGINPEAVIEMLDFLKRASGSYIDEGDAPYKDLQALIAKAEGRSDD